MAGDDILTEGELDALMDSVEEGVTGSQDNDDGEYRRFDFSAREHSLLREFTALGSLLERQGELLKVALEGAFSLEFATRPLEWDLISVADTLASLERAAGVTAATLAPLGGVAFSIASPQLLSFVVNAYFGGVRLGAEGAPARTTLTPTELRVAERIAEQQFACLVEAWIEKLPLERGDLHTLGAPDRLEALPRGDMLLRLRFELRSGEDDFPLDLLLPFEPLEPYRERFAPPRKKEGADAETNTWEPFFRRELPHVEIELAGVLATREMALAELLELAPGAVIPIPPPEEVSVRADGVTLAEGRYGSLEGNKAVQLQRLASVLRAAGR